MNNEQKDAIVIKRHCPFCKHGEVQLRAIVDGLDDNDYYGVLCLNCGARGPLAVNQRTAVDYWNNERERHTYHLISEDEQESRCVCNAFLRRAAVGGPKL
jgi:Lar family restriction alleviation protein